MWSFVQHQWLTADRAGATGKPQAFSQAIQKLTLKISDCLSGSILKKGAVSFL